MAAIVLRDYQNSSVHGVRLAYRSGHKRVILVAPTGAGKCLAKNTPILMFDGTIKMVQDVLVGDLLMGPDSQPRRVDSLARGSEMMYRITPRKGDPYVVNESHILSLKVTGISKNQLTAPNGDKLKSGDICNIPVKEYLTASATFKHCTKGWRAAVDFRPNSDLLLDPYILGVWLGDGNSNKSSITTADPEVADAFITYASANGMDVTVERNSEKSVNLHLKNDGGKVGRAGLPFGRAIRQLGVIGNKHIPLSYKTGSRQDRLELLAGLLDTDGHYDGKGYEFTQKSERLMDDVLFLARSLGFSCYKSKRNKTCTNTGVVGEYFICTISGNLDLIPCRVARQKAAPRKINKDNLVTGISVDPIGVGEYFGFSISGNDRLFLLGDFTVTHNTIMFSHIADNAQRLNKKVLIIAHRDTLIKQASRKLRDCNLRHGIIMAGFTPDLNAKVQVASVQTLVRRLEKLKFIPDIIVIDEAHLSAAKSYVKVIEHFSDAIVLGVTGSPCRLDNKPLGSDFGGLYDHMVIGVTIRELIDRGFLVQPTVYASEHLVDLSGVKKSMGDYDTAELGAIMDKPKLTGSAVDQYLKVCPDKPAVAWCVTVQHAQHVADEFNARGVKAAMLCGDHDTAYRDDILGKLASGEIRVVTFVGILVEGVDVPEITAIILLRPTMSLASYLQVIGRGLRPVYAGDVPSDATNAVRLAAIANSWKNKCYVLDHAGLVFKHGFADDVRDWSLDWGEKKKAGKKKVKDEVVNAIQCRGCWHVFTPLQGKEHADQLTLKGENPNGHTCCCPDCGKPVERPNRKIEEEDGELTEITKDMADKLRKQRRNEVHGARSMEQLLQVAAQRGYSASWAEHVYNSRLRKQEKQQVAVMQQRIARMLEMFSHWSVSRDMLERYLAHDVDLATEADLHALTKVYHRIKTGTPVKEIFIDPSQPLQLF